MLTLVPIFAVHFVHVRSWAVKASESPLLLLFAFRSMLGSLFVGLFLFCE